MHPRVAAAQKKTKKTCELDLPPMTLKFNRVHRVVKVHVHANFIKLSAAVYELSC